MIKSTKIVIISPAYYPSQKKYSLLVWRVKYRQAISIMEIFPCEDDSYTPSDASLDTEVVSSNHFESVASMKQRLKDAGFMFVERSVLKFGKQIGRGGQGTVYEASVSFPYIDRPMKMAVKKFNSQLGMSQGQYPLELWNSKRDHVLRPSAFFFDDDASLCMLMPLYRGDLRIAIDNELKNKNGPPFEEFVIFTLIIRLAMGMEGLHSTGVCHRDLKAANVLVNSAPTSMPMPVPLDKVDVKDEITLCIADFEDSKNVKGTAFWRSPEDLMSLRTGIPLTDQQWQAADVYSFGMLCYEIVTGEIPFKDKRYMDYDIVINGGRPELPEYVPELLRKIIMDCWDPNPECRPALMLKAQGDPLLKLITTAWEMLQGFSESKLESIEFELMQLREIVWEMLQSFSESKLESIEFELMQLREIVWREYMLNDDAIVVHQDHASWGVKYVHYAKQFIELLRKEMM